MEQASSSLPVKPSKKRWVPRKKKAGSKPKTARRLNTAVKAATKKPVAMPPIPTFKVGDLVVGVGTRADAKGLVKAVEEAEARPALQFDGDVVTVFWFDRMQDARERARYLKHVAA